MKTISKKWLDEWQKCKDDPIYFFNTYIKIRHPKRGLLSFNTYPFQDDVVQQFEQHRFNIILKSRQLGLSTITAAYAVWKLLFYTDQDILVIATKLDVAKNFIRKCKDMIWSIPDQLKLCEIELRAQEIFTDQGSKIKAIPTSADAGRSESLSLLIIDEAAFVEGLGELWKGLYFTLSTGGSAILLSTPHGQNNVFYEIYNKAEKKENEFNPIKLPYTVHPEYNSEKWFRETSRNMTPREIAQELLCDFAGSGDTFIDAEILKTIEHNIRPPKRRMGINNLVHIWNEPNPKHRYIMSCDVALGNGKDYSSFHIFDLDSIPIDITAEFQGKLPPDRFAELINEYGRIYNTAAVAIEKNAFGTTTIQKLIEYKYPKLWSSLNEMFVSWDTHPAVYDYGVFTSFYNRSAMLAKMEEGIRNGLINIRSERMFKELKTFVINKQNKAVASNSKNDDLILALAIGMWIIDKQGHVMNQQELLDSMLNNIKVNSVKSEQVLPNNQQSVKDEYLPFGYNTYQNPFMKQSGMARQPQLSKAWEWLIK